LKSTSRDFLAKQSTSNQFFQNLKFSAQEWNQTRVKLEDGPKYMIGIENSVLKGKEELFFMALFNLKVKILSSCGSQEIDLSLI
jgi:hypothetical protein